MSTGAYTASTSALDYLEFVFPTAVTLNSLRLAALKDISSSYTYSEDFQYSTDDGVTWTTHTTTGIVMDTGDNRAMQTVLFPTVTASRFRLSSTSRVAASEVQFACNPAFYRFDSTSSTVKCTAPDCTVDIDFSSVVLVDGSIEGSTISISADAVEIDGDVTASFRGYAAGTGPGAGRTSLRSFDGCGQSKIGGSGGAHGGFGHHHCYKSIACLPDLPGGSPYGLAREPWQYGSGGGTGVPDTEGVALGEGGAGGGRIRIAAANQLVVLTSAHVDAVGQDIAVPSSGVAGGGGAGGSIWLSARHVMGTGDVDVHGGSSTSTPAGGGGSGGRIAVVATERLESSLTFEVHVRCVMGCGLLWVVAGCCGLLWVVVGRRGVVSCWFRPLPLFCVVSFAETTPPLTVRSFLPTTTGRRLDVMQRRRRHVVHQRRGL